MANECLQFADSSTQYTVTFYWAVTTLTTVGYGEIVANTNMDKTVVMAAMFFSGTLQVCSSHSQLAFPSRFANSAAVAA